MQSTENSNGQAAASTTQNNSTETKTPGKIVEAGTPTVAAFTPRQQEEETVVVDNKDQQNDNGNGADAGGKEKGKDEVVVDDPSEEQIKKYFEKQGIEWDGKVETLKEKLSPTQSKPEPTAEEKSAQEKALEQRMLKIYLDNGGSIEQFAALKEIASIENLKDLSIRQIRQEMKDDFSEEEIQLVLDQRQKQLDAEQLEQGVDESDEDYNKRKEFLKKQAAYADKKINRRGEAIKNNATKALDQLRQAVEAEDIRVEEDKKFSSKVDEFFSNFDSKITVEIGKVNDKDVDPVDIDTSSEPIQQAIEKVKAVLKDPKQREELFFNPDNSFNLASIGKILLRNEILESAVKKALLEGQSRQVTAFEKTFGGKTAQEIGIGGSNQQTKGQKGKIATAGQPEVVVR